MKIIDFSQPIVNNMPVFPQDPDVLIEETLNSAKDDFTLSILKTGLHTGTHIDAPYHFFSNGRKVNEIGLDELVISSKSVKILNIIQILSPRTNNHLKNFNENIEIQKEHFAKINITKGDIIIIQTNWSENWGLKNYFTKNPYLSYESAEFLVKNEIKGLAVDGPSIDKFGETDIHKELLSNDIWIVENLKNLDKIPISNASSLEFFFIPLKLNNEASPIRAFAKIKDK